MKKDAAYYREQASKKLEQAKKAEEAAKKYREMERKQTQKEEKQICASLISDLKKWGQAQNPKIVDMKVLAAEARKRFNAGAETSGFGEERVEDSDGKSVETAAEESSLNEEPGGTSSKSELFSWLDN